MSKGLFVTFEGIDGAGKSTIIPLVEAKLNEMGYDVSLTAEPSEHWTGKDVRKAISSETAEDPLTAFYLFMADRNKHILEDIVPNVNSGSIVLSDRYADSTRVYQFQALKHLFETPDDCKQWIEMVMGPMQYDPDLTILLDITVEESIEREASGDVYENESFLQRVRFGYELLYETNERIIKVDASKSIDAVVTECVTLITMAHEGEL